MKLRIVTDIAIDSVHSRIRLVRDLDTDEWCCEQMKEPGCYILVHAGIDFFNFCPYCGKKLELIY